MNSTLLAALLFLHSAVARETTMPGPQEMQRNVPRGVVVSGKVTTKNGAFQPGFVQTVTLNPEPFPTTLAAPPLNSLGDPSESLEVAVRKDGTFEFRSVRPGRYTLRTLPHSAGVSVVSVEVRYQNVRDIEIAVPFQLEVSGRIMNLPRNLVIHPIIQADQGNFTMATPALDDGTFKLRLTEGENRILVSKLPPGLVVKSVTFGQVDISRSPLNLDVRTKPETMIVTLETDTLPAISANTTNP